MKSGYALAGYIVSYVSLTAYGVRTILRSRALRRALEIGRGNEGDR